MTRLKKLTIAVLTLGVGLYAVWFLVNFPQLGNQLNSNQLPTFGPFANFLSFWFVHMALTIFNVGLVIFYLKHLYKKNKRIKEDEKALWVFYIILGFTVGMLIYWYHYIWPEKA